LEAHQGRRKSRNSECSDRGTYIFNTDEILGGFRLNSYQLNQPMLAKFLFLLFVVSFNEDLKKNPLLCGKLSHNFAMLNLL